MASKAPQELTDMIFDFLHDDNETLLSSALVCRDWLHSTRYHLFSSLSITGDKDAGFEPFLDYLDETPAVRGLVRQLTLQGHTTNATSPQGHTVIDVASIHTLLARLPSLHSLALDTLHWNTSTIVPVERHDARPFGTLILRRLSSQPDRTITSDAMLDVFSFFSSIRNLHLSHINFEYKFEFVVEQALNPIPTGEKLDGRLFSVDNLTISQTSFVKMFLDGLRRSKTTNSLRSLSIQAGGVHDAYMYRFFLFNAASSLRHLEFDLVDRRRPLFVLPDTVQRTFSQTLPACTSLRTLHLRFLADHNDHFPRTPLDVYGSGYSYVPAIVPDIPLSVQSFKITIVIPRGAKEDRVMALAQILQYDAFQESVTSIKKLMNQGELKEFKVVVVREDEGEVPADENDEIKEKLEAELERAFEACPFDNVKSEPPSAQSSRFSSPVLRSAPLL